VHYKAWKDTFTIWSLLYLWTFKTFEAPSLSKPLLKTCLLNFVNDIFLQTLFWEHSYFSYEYDTSYKRRTIFSTALCYNAHYNLLGDCIPTQFHPYLNWYETFVCLPSLQDLQCAQLGNTIKLFVHMHDTPFPYKELLCPVALVKKSLHYTAIIMHKVLQSLYITDQSFSDNTSRGWPCKHLYLSWSIQEDIPIKWTVI